MCSSKRMSEHAMALTYLELPLRRTDLVAEATMVEKAGY